MSTNDVIPVNTRGIASATCVACGGDTFKTLVKLDEDFHVTWWTLNCYCAECDSAVTIPSPGSEYDDD